MALLIKKAIAGYLHAERDLIDPRTQDWFLVPNSWLIVGLLAVYNYFVLVLGPSIMKNRKPFELRTTLIGYNFIQVVVSVYICVECLSVYIDGYSLKCQPIEWDVSPRAVRTASTMWLYYMIKVVDLLDTVFFVLRKKNNQVSFLHVYHHTGMVMLGHIATKWVPGGHGLFIPMINSAVHAVMYGYYLLTAWDAEMKRNIWWKKNITQMQIGQFFCTAFSLTLPLVYQCGYPNWISFILIPNNICIFLLFSDFYIRSYWRKPSKARSQENARVPTDQKLN